MKKKIGTILDEELLISAKQLAIAQNMTLSQIFEEALRKYFKLIQKSKKHGNIVEQTKGSMRTRPEILKAVMEADAFYES